MKITCLASGSTGNCYLINDSNSTLLIEVGIQIKKIRNILNDLTKVDGVLISHEHQDHSKYAKDMLLYSDIYASYGTFEALQNRDALPKKYDYKKHIVKHNTPFEIGSFKIVPFDVKHDAVEPLGFLIYSKITKEKLLFATDTYYIEHQFKGLNYIMIEANYCKELLSESLTSKEQIRLLKSHFEFSNVKKFLQTTDSSKLKEIYLLHLSDRHSDRKRFKKEIEELIGVSVIVCGKGGKIKR